MESWPWALVLLSLFCCLSLTILLEKSLNKKKLPPGPPAVPLLGNLLWLWRSISDLETVLRELRPKYGPIITIHIGSLRLIFVTDHDLAHKVLFQHGAVFADRPSPASVSRLVSSNKYNVNTAPYGPMWRLLRGNLMSGILHPSRIKLFSHGRGWVLNILLDNLRAEAQSGDGVVMVKEPFQHAIFCLLVLMCFGEKLDEKTIRRMESAQRDLLLLYGKNRKVFFLAPNIAKRLFRKRWNTLCEIRRSQKEIFTSLIKAREELKRVKGMKGSDDDKHSFHYSYVDSLLQLHLHQENGRKLNDREMISLCSEFLNAGTDTTSTALQWIMANLVKDQDVQAKLWDEIKGVVGESGEEIKEEDLHRMPYLKAVILEGLRRHPPGHLVLPHAVTDEITIDGYVIPKHTLINFTVADLGRDEKVWKEPLEFKPERFFPGGEGDGVDITGRREIKMMPFGAGRRICPALGLAMLHLEYFVANLVREFEWKDVDGEKTDLSEKQEFTMVMKNPLRARIYLRRKN